MYEKYLICKQSKFNFKRNKKYLATFYLDNIVVVNKYVFTTKSNEKCEINNDYLLINIYKIFYTDAELRMKKLKKINKESN